MARLSGLWRREKNRDVRGGLPLNTQGIIARIFNESPDAPHERQEIGINPSGFSDSSVKKLCAFTPDLPETIFVVVQDKVHFFDKDKETFHNMRRERK